MKILEMDINTEVYGFCDVWNVFEKEMAEYLKSKDLHTVSYLHIPDENIKRIFYLIGEKNEDEIIKACVMFAKNYSKYLKKMIIRS